MGSAADITEWIAAVSLDQVPEEAIGRCRAAVIDTVAAILAGTAEPVSRIALGWAADDGGRPAAAVLGTAFRCPPEGAAFLNGISGHALDYDDVGASSTAHPSVVVFPAALAAAELTGASGRQLLEGYLVGIELMAKLGLAMGHEHYTRGWHATSTLGTVAAAMAAGKVMRLDSHQLQHALAIAISEAGGSRQNFGTMVKPFHAGHAASCGVKAARLAAAGMTGAPEALDGPLGYFALFSFGHGRPAAVAESLGRPWDILNVGLSVKKYPCCFATHRVADGVLDLRSENQVEAAEVSAVRVTVPVGLMEPLIHRRPLTGLQAKFSLEYVIAAGLVDGAVNLESFTDQMVQRSQTAVLCELVEVSEDSSIKTGTNPIEDGHVIVEMTLRDGRRLRKEVHQPRGGPALPLTTDQLAAKFHDCAKGVLVPDRAASALGRLSRLEAEPALTALIADLCAPVPARVG
ncbi:MAG: MmgE/PrpD family protein [Candidatus Dormibacteraceae bacterium]